MIVVIDYGLGNFGSIVNMFKRVGASAATSSDPKIIAAAEKLVLPGVGAFDHGIRHIQERGLLDVLNEKVLGQKTPVLGVCLGCQLITKSSEEGGLPGLGWIDAATVRFHFGAENRDLKVPHMGWNTVQSTRSDTLFAGFSSESEPAFYFVHSYHLVCAQAADVLATCRYGYDFPCAVQHENIFGTQFHPEKSHRFGKKLLSNFARL
jgi:glutamine amidotransferase